jgi:DNA-binding beta-propeller fold protein YncE
VLGRVAKEIEVGIEPRGCALTSNGAWLYVANHTEGTVSIFAIPSANPLEPALYGSVPVGRNPTAIAITDRGTRKISDDTVFVTQIFAELNPDFKDPTFDGNGEARDLGKQGVVHAFPAGNANPPITKITLKPLAILAFPPTACSRITSATPSRPPNPTSSARTRRILQTPQTRTTRRGYSPTNSYRR